MFRNLITALLPMFVVVTVAGCNAQSGSRNTASSDEPRGESSRNRETAATLNWGAVPRSERPKSPASAGLFMAEGGIRAGRRSFTP